MWNMRAGHGESRRMECASEAPILLFWEVMGQPSSGLVAAAVLASLVHTCERELRQARSMRLLERCSCNDIAARRLAATEKCLSSARCAGWTAACFGTDGEGEDGVVCRGLRARCLEETMHRSNCVPKRALHMDYRAQCDGYFHFLQHMPRLHFSNISISPVLPLSLDNSHPVPVINSHQ